MGHGCAVVLAILLVLACVAFAPTEYVAVLLVLVAAYILVFAYEHA